MTEEDKGGYEMATGEKGGYQKSGEKLTKNPMPCFIILVLMAYVV